MSFGHIFLVLFFLSSSHKGVPQEAQQNISIMHTTGTESVSPSPLQFKEVKVCIIGHDYFVPLKKDDLMVQNNHELVFQDIFCTI